MPRILVVDDEPCVRRMISRALLQHGLTPVAVEHTQEALAVLAGGGVDAVLLDVVLGRENGWEALRRLRESSGVPIVMMSGVCVDDGIRLDAEKLGAQGVLQKPFTTDQLLLCVTGLLPPSPAAGTSDTIAE